MEGAEAKAYYGLAVNYRVLEALVERLLVKETLTGNEVHTSATPCLLSAVLASSLSASPLLWSVTCSFSLDYHPRSLRIAHMMSASPFICSIGPWAVC